ncbi:MAG: GNAT family N-acetyltransferase [bacterium]
MPGETLVAPHVEVVHARHKDAEVVAPLFDLYRQFYGAESDITAARAFLRHRLMRDESVVLVVRHATDIRTAIGFAQLYHSFSSLALMPTLVLNDLFVASDWRGRGVGKRLIEATVAFGIRAGASMIELSTQHTNQRALALYGSLGFVRDTEFAHLSLALPASTRERND